MTDTLLSSALPHISKFFEVNIAYIGAYIQRLRGDVLIATTPTLVETSSSLVPARSSFDKQPLSMIWTLLLIIGAGAVLAFWQTRPRKYHYAPGPKAYPVIGNLLDFPAISDMVTRVQRWKEVRLLLVFGT